MRGKKFIINSTKMDLHRVVTATGNINKELPQQSVIEFMEHADKDFGKIELTKWEQTLRQHLQNLQKQLPYIKDPHSRLRWAEDVMTIRCRL
ncbi:hypothetical protein A2716_04285 [candidate division WWE3 bacterium RIFCSPHIGHO2_01_FULL_40_23]|uniref:Uncharacterized protein n=1 Tax=candidate division WWE3 bacterium RIFCSPLOWO2_01_FULL_41_18 TaxID=1802625 RepID=A0A1F4VCW9_UNCKA|nr:MAG: hypothetical protein A2716_04285 [candidate division WWE3 bacterium RIFCSPHIGHO2_01_FULL_40_23]OGC55092.1 MAG: hypothetical protein A3A78_03895 [candidate division WWE3 bacterium RIFCSPLOWO2_01_FULL_41_18]